MKKFILMTFLGVLAACGGAEGETAVTFDTPIPNQAEIHEDGAGHEHIDPAQATGQMEVVVVPSELVVGQNRFAVGLFDGNGEMVHEAQVHFHYFDLGDVANPALDMEATAVRIQDPEGYTTIFAHERDFDRAGTWGVEVQIILPDGTADIQRLAVEALADSISVTPGEKVPVINTPTLLDTGGDLSRLTSAVEPNPAFYEIPLSEALANGKPTLFLLATPAFCQTRFCGPAYDVTNELYADYGDAFNFIHVEVFTGLPDPAATNWQQAPVMNAFGLNTEPWIYLIDKAGTAVYRVEGMFTTAEVEQHLQAMLNDAST